MSFVRRSVLWPVLALAFLAIGLIPASARTITDQLNRTVTLPHEVNRIVVLQHQTLDILVELGAADKVVGVLAKWQSLIPGLDKYAPQIAGLPTMPTDEMAIRFLETGTNAVGKMAMPPMPQYRFEHEDAVAVVAYLRSLKK